MEILDLQEVIWQDKWRCVSVRDGEVCAEEIGIMKKLVLFANNWGFLQVSCKSFFCEYVEFPIITRN